MDAETGVCWGASRLGSCRERWNWPRSPNLIMTTDSERRLRRKLRAVVRRDGDEVCLFDLEVWAGMGPSERVWTARIRTQTNFSSALPQCKVEAQGYKSRDTTAYCEK